MIANPNTTPVQAQTVTPKANQVVQPALTAQTAAKPTALQTKPVSSIMTPSAPTQVNQPQAIQPALVQKTPATAPKTAVATTGVTTPQTVKTNAPVTTQQVAPKVASSVQKAQTETRQASVQRQNGAQINSAMPHQGKADKNGVKFVGVETMPKTNDNASIRGYAMIAQVPAKSYGVDVSNYQGTNLSPYAWQGAKFAIVKLTEGTGYINPYAAGQIASAKANNMLAMGYVFAHSGGNTTEAKQEAEYGLAEAQRAGLPKGSYIAYDYETGASGSVPANTAAIETFMQTVLQAGYLPLLYSGNAYLHAHVNVNKVTNDYKGSLWVASYPTMGATYSPNWNYFPSNPGVAIWQFTDNWKGMNVDGDVTTLPLNGESSSSTANTTPAPSPNTGSSNNSSYKSDYHVGDQVTINSSAKTWTNGATINHAVTNGHPYTVIQVAPGDGGAVCLKDPQANAVMGWMNDWEVTPYTAPKQNTPVNSKPTSQSTPTSAGTSGSKPLTGKPTNNSTSSTVNSSLPLPNSVSMNGNTTIQPVKVEVLPDKTTEVLPSQAVVGQTRQVSTMNTWLINTATNQFLPGTKVITFTTPVTLTYHNFNSGATMAEINQGAAYDLAHNNALLEQAIAKYYANPANCPQGFTLDSSKGNQGVLLVKLTGSSNTTHKISKDVNYVVAGAYVFFKPMEHALNTKPENYQPVVHQQGVTQSNGQVKPSQNNVSGSSHSPIPSATQPTLTQPVATTIPEININVTANASAKAQANAAAKVNVVINGKAQADNQEVVDNSTGMVGSLTEAWMDTPCTVQAEDNTMKAFASANQKEKAPTTITTATPAAGTIATPVAPAGKGNIVLPATGQKNNTVLAGLTAVAMSVLGTAGLLNRKRSKD